MTIWLDAHLSPELGPWITERFRIEARAARDLGLRDAKDPEIYRAARDADVILMWKSPRPSRDGGSRPEARNLTRTPPDPNVTAAPAMRVVTDPS
mgnify:FL=1